MKHKGYCILSLLLACTMVFSLVSVGSAGSIQVAGSASADSKTVSSDSGTYRQVATVEEAVQLIEDNQEVYSADQPNEKVPTIILPGISQSQSYLANDDGTPYVNADGDTIQGGVILIDQSTLPNILIKNLLQPLVTTVALQKDMGFTDAVYKTIGEVLSIQKSGLDGKPVNNLKTITYEYPISQMTPEDRDKFYREIPMQSVSDIIGEDFLYLFAFPLIGQPMENGENLNTFIQMVKTQTDCDKVNVISISLGGTVLTAYLDLYDGSDLNQIINVVSLLQGTDILGDFFARNFNLSDEFVYSEYIPSILKESNGYGTLGYVINIALRILPRAVFEKTLTRAVDSLLDTLMLNCPQFWAMVPPDRYQALAERYLNDADHAQLRTIMDRFYLAQCNLEDNLKKVVEEHDVRVSNICGYDLTYSDGDYNYFGIMASAATTNADGIIDIDSTSLGATYAPANTTLAADYVPLKEGYISPDGSIDASTCLFPDHVWFFYDQHHEVGRNDVVIKLAAKIISGEVQNTADDSANFPQFNGNRNTRNLTRSWLGLCEQVLADPSAYNPDDVTEVQAAYDEAKAMLADTVCDSAKAVAVNERVQNALRRVGLLAEAEDPAKNQALEAVCKFLNDSVYIIFGPQGFSDGTTFIS